MSYYWLEEANSVERPNHLILATCARDIARHVVALPRLLRAVTRFAYDVTLMVVESDSSDATPELLVKLSSEIDNVEVYSLGHLRHRIQGRTDRIAYCRNLYLQRSCELLKGCPNSLLVVFDSDGLLGRRFISNASTFLEKTLLKLSSKPWLSCSGVTIPYYYDIYALREDIWSPDDCWVAANHFSEQLGYEPELAYRLAIRSRQICLSEAKQLIRVKSAFNGLAIYKGDAISGVSYSGIDSSGVAVCEHVPFHYEQSRLHPSRSHFIDPELVVGFTPLSYRSASHRLESWWYVANLFNQLRLAGHARLGSVRRRIHSLSDILTR